MKTKTNKIKMSKQKTSSQGSLPAPQATINKEKGETQTRKNIIYWVVNQVDVAE